MLTTQNQLALLMHGNLAPGGYGKMGLGLLRYSKTPIAAVIDSDHAGGDAASITGIPCSVPIVSSVRDAAALGADVLVIGVATPGGTLPPKWWVEIGEGLDLGMSLVNGLHVHLESRADLVDRLKPGRFIWDVRKEPPALQTGTGSARHLRAKRVLTVGTDMAIGKMTASLEMESGAQSRGYRARFLATGQIGICIAGEGVALDAVRVDFAAGAVEALVTPHGHDHDVLFIEGQGSALHPSSTAWLPLIRGSCPTHLILCHRAGQETIRRLPEVRIPALQEVIRLYRAVSAAGGSFPTAPVVGIALNCAGLNDAEARREVDKTSDETQLPATDVLRFGVDPLLDALDLPAKS